MALLQVKVHLERRNYVLSLRRLMLLQTPPTSLPPAGGGDVNTVIGASVTSEPFHFTHRDVILYNLGGNLVLLIVENSVPYRNFFK